MYIYIYKDLSTLWFECGGMTSNVMSLVAFTLHILIILPCICQIMSVFKNVLFWQGIENKDNVCNLKPFAQYFFIIITKK